MVLAWTVGARCIVDVWLLLLLLPWSASEETCIDGALYAADQEWMAKLELLQTGLEMKAGSSGPEVGPTSHAAQLVDVVVGSISRLLASRPSWVSPVPMQQKMASSCLAKAHLLYRAALGGKDYEGKWMQPTVLGCSILVVAALAYGFLYFLGAFCGQTTQQQDPRWVSYRASQEQVQPDEVWTKSQYTAQPEENILLPLFDRLDAQHHFGAPSGYISRADLQTALRDNRMVDEMKRFRIDSDDCAVVFSLLEKDGLVSKQEFVNECMDLAVLSPSKRRSSIHEWMVVHQTSGAVAESPRSRRSSINQFMHEFMDVHQTSGLVAESMNGSAVQSSDGTPGRVCLDWQSCMDMAVPSPRARRTSIHEQMVVPQTSGSVAESMNGPAGQSVDRTADRACGDWQSLHHHSTTL